MRFLKTALLIFGVVLALAGVASVTSSGFVLGIYRLYGAPSGFFTAPSQILGSNGFALTVPDVNGQLEGRWERWLLPRLGATVRVTGSSQLPAPVFIGVAATPRVSEYLSGVARERVTGIDLAAGSVSYERVSGEASPALPEEQDFWVVTAAGSGSQTLEWTLREGDWALVIMNADGSAPVAADVELGARFEAIYPFIVGLTLAGVVLLAIGATLALWGARSPS